eukprot:13759623-Ditylum_brightwellii.AAC.1
MEQDISTLWTPESEGHTQCHYTVHKYTTQSKSTTLPCYFSKDEQPMAPLLLMNYNQDMIFHKQDQENPTAYIAV